jgi:hypothetical protein
MRYADAEIALLRRIVQSGRRPTSNDLPGRTDAAINRKLFLLGLHTRKVWTPQEIERLKVFRSQQRGKRVNPVIPWRTPDAVASKARELGLLDPVLGEATRSGKKRAKELLSKRYRREFYAFLRRNAKQMSSVELGKICGVGPNFIRRVLTKLGCAPTWHELISRPGQREKTAEKIRRTKAERSREYRERRLVALERRRAELRLQDPLIREDSCLLCRDRWPVQPAFFHKPFKWWPSWKNAVRERVCRTCLVRALLDGRVVQFRSALAQLYSEARERRRLDEG